MQSINLYTKEQIDSNFYTKSEIDTMIENIDLSDYYTKSDIDTMIENIDLTNYYTKTETYSKTEIDTMIENIDLSDYYTKSETYSKTETDTIIQNLPVYAGVVKIPLPITVSLATPTLPRLDFGDFVFQNDDMVVVSFGVLDNAQYFWDRMLFTGVYTPNDARYNNPLMTTIRYPLNDELTTIATISSAVTSVSNGLNVAVRTNGTSKTITNVYIHNSYVLRKQS